MRDYRALQETHAPPTRGRRRYSSAGLFCALDVARRSAHAHGWDSASEPVKRRGRRASVGDEDSVGDAAPQTGERVMERSDWDSSVSRGAGLGGPRTFPAPVPPPSVRSAPVGRAQRRATCQPPSAGLYEYVDTLWLVASPGCSNFVVASLLQWRFVHVFELPLADGWVGGAAASVVAGAV